MDIKDIIEANSKATPFIIPLGIIFGILSYFEGSYFVSSLILSVSGINLALFLHGKFKS
ncbi:hypothetical protein IHV09_21955 [Fictibacillus sp. 23RED33]|uniref:hypothetical protein n=1 Tax=Fictibacillus sp. 23RED33 TaxID=2745879 RepID=UPI0018CE9261|nr:hypothetical protein [Fictibacillus sp. 23RED33]MBH0176224.1 hypothetical protein [Fictibacillus sp. 23RED33]